MGKIGVIPLLYGIACIVFNFAGIILKVIPDLGVIGSWLFNPLGMAFSGYIAAGLLGGNPISGLAVPGAEWAIGGLIAVIWSIGLCWVGIKLIGHKSSVKPRPFQ